MRICDVITFKLVSGKLIVNPSFIAVDESVGVILERGDDRGNVIETCTASICN